MSSFCDEVAEDASDKPRHGTTDWKNNPLCTSYNVAIGGADRHVSLLNLRRRDERPDVPWNGNPAQIILDCLCAKMPSVSALLLTQQLWSRFYCLYCHRGFLTWCIVVPFVVSSGVQSQKQNRCSGSIISDTPG